MTARVELDCDGPVLIVTLADEPDRLPAYDGAPCTTLGAAWVELDGDAALRAAVLTSDSERAFCVGADVMAVAAGRFDDPPYPEVAESLAAKPVVAAIEGGASEAG